MGKLIDSVKFVVAAQCIDTQTAWNNQTYDLGNAINVENYRHVTIVLIGGVAAGTQLAVKVVCAATDAACVIANVGTTAALVPMEWVYKNIQTAVQSDTWVKTAVVSDTFTPTTTTNHLNWVIEIETASMSLAPWLTINKVASGAANYMAALYILSQPRYISAEDAPTAIV